MLTYPKPSRSFQPHFLGGFNPRNNINSRHVAFGSLLSFFPHAADDWEFLPVWSCTYAEWFQHWLCSKSWRGNVCVCVCLESGSAQTARLESDIILKILTTLQMLQLSVPLTLLFLLNNIQLVDLSLRCFSFAITQPFKHYVILDKFTQYIIFLSNKLNWKTKIWRYICNLTQYILYDKK